MSVRGTNGPVVRWGGLDRLFGATSTIIVAGWWKISTRATNRCLWSTGSTGHKLFLSGTASMRLQVDYSTTDRIHLTSGGVDFLDTWFFIWVAFSSVPSELVYIGNYQYLPTRNTLTLAQTQVGTMVAQNQLFLMGDGLAVNTTTAFDGHCSQVYAVANPIGGAGGGGLTDQVTQDFLYQRYILPMYYGTYDANYWWNTRINYNGADDVNNTGGHLLAPLDAVAGVTGSISQYTAHYIEYGGVGGSNRLLSDGTAGANPALSLEEPITTASLPQESGGGRVRQMYEPRLRLNHVTTRL